DRQWLYQSRDGTILFDSAGVPLLRDIDPESIAQEKGEWERTIRTVQTSILHQWTLGAESVFLEIGNSIPEDFRQSVKAHLQVSLDEYRDRVRMETDRLICWSTLSFDSVRNDDNFSLRNKSEEETARSLAERLILETKLSLLDTDQALNEGVSDLKSMAVQEASFSIENWDKSFQDEFRKGLEKWNQAE
ncbi:hypothetical protein, partial [Oceanispirochaeta sp.]|uniref:hypothetical protein n=1 Tax=Oceanispirochaeta sp. TaxID=2035350 RepID=UPI0026227DB6